MRAITRHRGILEHEVESVMSKSLRTLTELQELGNP